MRILIGDCRDVLKTLDDESVHCCVTSPPYWGLRDYGVAGQLGLEPDLNDYIATMVAVFREVRRVLRKDGTLWLNMGDSYATSPSGLCKVDSMRSSTLTGGKETGRRAHHDTSKIGRMGEGLKPKDLCGIPWRLAFALQADGWWLRQDIIWSKPNPMPESVTDRCTKSHEYIFLLSKSAKYFYDAEAIKEPNSTTCHSWTTKPLTDDHEKTNFVGNGHSGKRFGSLGDGRNKRSVWEVATAPFSEAHFATFPPALIEPCIKAGTSEKGCCAKCGAPWVREVEITSALKNINNRTPPKHEVPGQERSARNTKLSGAEFIAWKAEHPNKPLGWSPSCSCDGNLPAGIRERDPIPCTVLDPFGGAGTTGLVADRLQRNAILIELNPEYTAMAERRIHDDAPLFVMAAE